MEDTKLSWTDRLAKYTIYAVLAIIIGAICWYFRDVIIYILVAGVLSLLGAPLAGQFKKIHIKNHYMPAWAASVLTIIAVFAVFAVFITAFVPIISSVVREISALNVGSSVKSIAVPLSEFNSFLISKFPDLGADFRIEGIILEQIQKFISGGKVTSAISSVTSFLGGVGVALFSTIFISFFFFKDEHQFGKIIAALVPDRQEEEAMHAMEDIRKLLTRYFLGLLVEVTGVALLNFLGLLLIARLGFNAALGIAFMTGVLNIIPYVGPWIGGALGTFIAVIMKYTYAPQIGLDVSFWVFVAILITIFCAVQVVDNYFFQPTIYSNSIKAHPLEIFIVLLMAGHIGGIIGMLLAIPCYTVIRVIAGRFFRKVKFVRRLIPEDRL